MRKKIAQSMILSASVVLLISYIVFTIFIYHHTVEEAKTELEQEADYIIGAIEISGTDYLSKMDSVREHTRVTYILSDGEVVYDSHKQEDVFHNHSDRPEVKQAFEEGEGEDIRKSDTVHKEMIYYAEKLEDGNILRVSKNINTAFSEAYQIFPMILSLAIVMLVATWLISRTLAKKLVTPVNKIDLESPLENDVYEEFHPLLVRIDEQNKQKDAVAKMRKEFSANVSHELKTPLTSISGYAELMKSDLVKPEDIKGFSEKIYNEAARLITLIEDIIKLSRLDEEEVGLDTEDVDLYQLAREVVERLQKIAAKNSVKMEITGEKVIYNGMKQILDEMIYNICENAIKYNKKGGTVSIWVGETLSGPKIIIEDDGIGIPKEAQDRIFERFYRVDKSHSKENGGTGLGLSIVKHGALLHKAQINIESEYEKGTKIEIVF